MGEDDLPRWKVLGRPVKSTALGLAVIMATFSVYNLFNIGVFGISILGDIVAGLAGVVFVILCWGWWANSQRLSEAGLLLAAGVYITRTIFLLFTDPRIEGMWIGVGVSIIAVGAYLKEKIHPDEADLL
jgi:hypothetical protein